MFPAGQRRNAVQPAVDIGPVPAVEAERFVVEQVATARQIRIRDAASRDPVTLRQMRVEYLVRGVQTALKKADDLGGALVLGQEVHQEPCGARLAGQLVIVPKHPAQDLAPFFWRLATEPARLFRDVGLDHARLGQPDVAIDQNRRLAHFVDRRQVLRRARGTVEEVDEHRLPVLTRQFQSQCRLVAVAAFSEAIQMDHFALPPRSGADGPRQSMRISGRMKPWLNRRLRLIRLGRTCGTGWRADDRKRSSPAAPVMSEPNARQGGAPASSCRK